MVVMMSCLVFLNVLQVSFSQANHGFQDGSSTIAAPWRNQEPRQINRVLRQFDRWKPGIPRRPSGRPSDWMFIQFLGHTLYTNVQAYRCIQVYMVYIYIYGIYIIYIFKGKKQVCTCAIMLHPSSWFAAFGSLIQNWPRSEAIRTSHILGVGPLRASAFVSW